MKCTRVEKFLPLYVAGDLASRRRERAVEKHLATCGQCRRAATGYHASRELFRAATLSPHFDDAFYDELRDSVLARIGRDRTPAPPPVFHGLFNARLAYAASLALFLIVAALALHSYTRRASVDGARQKLIADAIRERPTTPATIKTSPATRPQSNDRPTARPFGDHASGMTSSERRAARSSLPKPGGTVEHAQNGLSSSSAMKSRTPSTAPRSTPAPSVTAVAVVAARGNAGETAATSGGVGETATQPDVSRIEIQTSDPNIRIIWLSPHTEDAARPLK